MKFKDYELLPFRSEFTPQVVKLLNYFWGENQIDNSAVFKWKYTNNINTVQPLGIVALFKGKVIAFRGYFALSFKVNSNRTKHLTLSPGDTCVHPLHQ